MPGGDLRLGGALFFVAAAILAAAVVGVTMLRRRMVIVAVWGPSMQPALRTGDRVLVRRARLGDLRPGQIVVIEKPAADGGWLAQPPTWPADSREWLIKRVAAVPGDPLPEAVSPVTDDADAAGDPVVPAGQLVVLGDNAAASLDSRQVGCIPAERLLGVMMLPLARR
jgi:signal peptidase I